MRFDSTPYYHVGEPYYAIGWDALMSEVRKEAQLLEDAGFTTMWFAEHHFAWDGYYNAAPNPLLVAADLIPRTKTLRLGALGTALPDRHPIHVAEDVAMLDRMSEGRMEFGIMRGANNRAGVQFHPAADRRNKEVNYRLFAECLEIIVKAWTQEAFTHEGEFYKFPVRGWRESVKEITDASPLHFADDGEMVALGLHPKPYQKPHPPIWQMADAMDSHIFAGERGINAMCYSPPVASIKERWRAYREAAMASGRELEYGENLAVMKPCFVVRSMDDEALSAARIGTNFLFDRSPLAKVGRHIYIGEGEKLTTDDKSDDWFDFLRRHGHLWVGTPDFVEEKLAELESELNCGHVGLFLNIPGLSFRQVMDSLSLFGEQVMPRFDRTAPAIGAGVAG